MPLNEPHLPQDIEAYIHRSGRTGRAGRTGVCVMFYKPQQEYMVPLVERRAGIHFQRIGAPQLSDVIGAAARDASRCGCGCVHVCVWKERPYDLNTKKNYLYQQVS